MRCAALALMLGGCSLLMTSSRPDPYERTCHSNVWPVLDLIGVPLATGMAALAMLAATSETQTTRENVVLYSTLALPPLYIASTVVGFSRNRRCRDELARRSR